MNLLQKYSPIIEDLKTLQSVQTIILFGSYAKNNSKPLSDLDICIIPKKNSSQEQLREIESYGNDELDISLFQALPLSLQFNILHEGKILYTTEDISTLKFKTTNKWFDFRQGLNRLYRNRGYRGIEIEE